jgi:hypothetical protein
LALRNELTKFQYFEFANRIVKVKVEPTNLEKEVVCALEETWVKATGFPRKAKKEMVIKEISHLVGDPVEVDEKSLKSEGVVRVKVLCKDALKIEGNILVFTNKQGHLIHWKSEKFETAEGEGSINNNNSKFDRHRDGSDEKDDSDDSDDNHDSGFTKLAQEQKEEEEKKKHMGKAGGTSQANKMDWEAMADEEFSLSQTRQERVTKEVDFENQLDMEMVGDKLKKEKAEMSVLDAIFEEKTNKLAHVIQL